MWPAPRLDLSNGWPIILAPATQQEIERRVTCHACNQFGISSGGGVLIGTHAFLAHCWNSRDQPLDTDFDHADNRSVALAATIDAQTHMAPTTKEGGFLPLARYKGSPRASQKQKDKP